MNCRNHSGPKSLWSYGWIWPEYPWACHNCLKYHKGLARKFPTRQQQQQQQRPWWLPSTLNLSERRLLRQLISIGKQVERIVEKQKEFLQEGLAPGETFTGQYSYECCPFARVNGNKCKTSSRLRLIASIYRIWDLYSMDVKMRWR